MTDKRFEYIAFDGFTDNGEYITPYQVVDLLNKQHEQIQFLNMKYAERTSIIGEQSLKIENLEKENEQLKQVLGSILIEVRRDISATNHSSEVKAFVNPNSFDLISDVLKKYGALKDWYE